MPEPIQVAEPEEPKVWRFFEAVPASKLETALNDMAKQGYQVYRMDRVEESVHGPLGASGPSFTAVVYDVVMFNPVYMGTKQMADLQAALTKAGLNVGGKPEPMPGPYPGPTKQP